MDTESVCSGRKSLTSVQKIMMVVFPVTMCVGGMSFSVMASFLPQNAYTKGLTSTDVGVILAMFSVATLILTFFFNYIISFTGSRFMHLTSTFICAGGLLPFAFVMYAKEGMPFYVSCLMCRFMQGVGFLGIQISTFSIVTQEYSEYLSTFVGIIEMAWGVGYAVGPSLGGFIYDLAGFEMPFFIVSGLLLVLNVIGFFTIKPQNSNKISLNDEESINALVFIKMPDLLIPMGCCMMSLIMITFLDVSLGPLFTETLNSTTTMAGIGFGLSAALYAGGAVSVGYLVDKKGCHHVIQIIGCAFGIIAFLIYGPVPGLGLDPSIPLLMISVSFLGLCGSFVYVPSLGIFLNLLRRHGIKVDQSVNTFASSCLVFFSNVGTLIGPILGGILVDEIEVGYSGLVLCIICATMGLLNIIHFIVLTVKSRNNDEEKQNLLK